MTKSTITDERIISVIERLEHFASNLKWTDVRGAQDLLTAADGLRELQERRKAAMDSEPVVPISFDEWSRKCALQITLCYPDFREKAQYIWDSARETMQPAPVVPDAATAIRACLSEFPESARDIVEECADIAENACRAAMLQSEPVTTANKLGNSPVIPDGWKVVPPIPTNAMYLATNGKDSLTEKYIAMIDAAPELPGLEPASFLDTWIPVSERMPDEGALVLVYTPPQPGDFPENVRIGFDYIDPDGDDPTYWAEHGESYEHFCCVACDGMTGPSEKAPYTHWMSLPAAPQEVK